MSIVIACDFNTIDEHKKFVSVLVNSSYCEVGGGFQVWVIFSRKMLLGVKEHHWLPLPPQVKLALLVGEVGHFC